jgi:hypothetical protein
VAPSHVRGVGCPAVRHGREPDVTGDRREPRPLMQLDRHLVPGVGEAPRAGGSLRHPGKAGADPGVGDTSSSPAWATTRQRSLRSMLCRNSSDQSTRRPGRQSDAAFDVLCRRPLTVSPEGGDGTSACDGVRGSKVVGSSLTSAPADRASSPAADRGCTRRLRSPGCCGGDLRTWSDRDTALCDGRG